MIVNQIMKGSDTMAGKKILATNKKARHDYFIDEVYECGIELKGTEVKSIRNGRINLKEGYASVDNGEVFLKQVHISPYEHGNIYNVDPLRVRKLLLHKYEIRKLIGATTIKGYSLIPMSVYLKRGKVKLELGLARGKKLYDKRQDLAKKDAQRRIEREIRSRY
ncbi:SsrA-binding protein [Peptostreptococcus russellii]|uniref:SsrA-binding protein n=2 Tax=Peptostreptococcus russellii TaxID=215200 RepID=A0A1H8GCE6_9FIRM|nr:SsrA-binding protein [Peptostreptococcus russellii]